MNFAERELVVKAAREVEKMGARCPYCGWPLKLLVIGSLKPEQHRVFLTCRPFCETTTEPRPTWEKPEGELPSHDRMVSEIFDAVQAAIVDRYKEVL